MNQSSAADPLAAWTLVDIPLVHDRRGSLCFAEANRHVPFAIERVYWIYGMSGGMQRGRHAHRSVQELLVATTGTFDVHCDNGFERATVRLDDPSRGLLVDSGVWRELDAFSAGSVCLVLASGPYDEEEYVRNYSTFAALAGAPLRPKRR